MPIMTTGGINLKNTEEYVKNGAVCIGGALYQYDTKEEIQIAASQFVEKYRSAKSKYYPTGSNV